MEWNFQKMNNMKRLFAAIMIISMVSISLFSFMGKEKSKSKDDAAQDRLPVSKPNEYGFEPGQEWMLVWSDEFEGDRINMNNWNFQILEAGHFNEEWQRYTDERKNAYIEDGCLIIKAIHESDEHAMGQYTSARLHTANKQTWKYGKIMARIRLPFGQGIWPAFWMLGANIDENGGDTPWPQSGEIDILELYGSKNDSVIEANIHHADASGSHANMGAVHYRLESGRFADDFHVFELDWDKNRVAWLVDGIEYASYPITADDMSAFHKEFFILLNVAVGGKWAGYPDSRSVFPQHMYVDWVRVYQKKQ
jgi:beta-glucanase (GH16 family)